MKKISLKKYNRISLIILGVLLIIHGIELVLNTSLVTFSLEGLDLFQGLFFIVILIDMGVLFAVSCIKEELEDPIL